MHSILLCAVAFLAGCVTTASIILHLHANNILKDHGHSSTSPLCSSRETTASSALNRGTAPVPTTATNASLLVPPTAETDTWQVRNILQSVRILVAIAAYDFSQIPHLEEVLDSYHDVCVAGARQIDVVVHATVAYPVALIDLWNTRFNCEAFQIQIALKPKSLRLHLVDCHRELFYNRLDDYDLFIYTEDDIQVSPTTVATYLYETQELRRYIQSISRPSAKYKPSDFNVGIVRYEYNYPANVIMDDKTRHATQNVTRVYWEHSGFQRPVISNAIYTVVEDDSYLAKRYFTMKNHHQGMFLATRDLLLAWKERCNFHVASNRPGRRSQPTEGTQRVWMSSQMLYGHRRCAVLQVLPKTRSFGALTVWHLPNKNYRRVGKYRKRVFSDGSETFDQPHPSLLSAMELHLGMRKAWPPEPQIPYRGIMMVDEQGDKDRTPLLERRMADFQRYVDNGGILSDEDYDHIALVEER